MIRLRHLVMGYEMSTVPAGITIPGLVERFERNVDAYRNGRYNETQLRREFVDPLFCALGSGPLKSRLIHDKLVFAVEP